MGAFSKSRIPLPLFENNGMRDVITTEVRYQWHRNIKDVTAFRQLFFTSLILVMIVLAAGCVQSSSPVKEGVFSVKLEASSDKVFAGNVITVYANVENRMVQDAKDVMVDIFGLGLFERGACNPEYAVPCLSPNFCVADLVSCESAGSGYIIEGKCSVGSCCSPSHTPSPKAIPMDDIKQDELKIATCKLTAPPADKMFKDEMEATVWASVSFNSRLQASQVVKMISKNEFEIRQKTGKLEKEPGVFTYRDDNIELTVTFSSEMPIVKKDTREFVTFKVKNIGNGFVQNIQLGEDFRLQNPDAGNGRKLVDENCFYVSPTPPLTPLTIGIIGNEFPAITCELNLPDINYLSNLLLLINIDYQYEVRQSLPVKIIR